MAFAAFAGIAGGAIAAFAGIAGGAIAAFAGVRLEARFAAPPDRKPAQNPEPRKSRWG